MSSTARPWSATWSRSSATPAWRRTAPRRRSPICSAAGARSSTPGRTCTPRQRNLARGNWRRREREGRALAAVDALTPVHHNGEDPWLRDLVARLPQRLRAPVLLHYYADLPVAEVAEQLRLPLGTVKRQLHEARALLLHVLEEPDA